MPGGGTACRWVVLLVGGWGCLLVGGATLHSQVCVHIEQLIEVYIASERSPCYMPFSCW